MSLLKSPILLVVAGLLVLFLGSFLLTVDQEQRRERIVYFGPKLNPCQRALWTHLIDRGNVPTLKHWYVIHVTYVDREEIINACFPPGFGSHVQDN